MDPITLEELKRTFSKRHAGWCVSLFMPTHRAGRETEQGPIRLKNLLREAEERLQAEGLRPPEIRELLAGPQRLLQDPGFWQHQSDGLVVFCSAEAFHFFRLPLGFDEFVVISRRFHLKPLLTLFTSDGTFYILALSQNQVRLLEGTRHGVDEVHLEGRVQSLSEAFPEPPAEKQLQFHTGAPATKGKRPAMFYGHDLSTETKDRIQRWFRTIDGQLKDILAGVASPMILAGVEYLFPLYREACTYPHLLSGGIAGNPEGLKPEELHRQAWSIVEPVFRKAREEAAARYRELAGTGRTTTDVKGAVSAAHEGRIEVLFVAVGLQVWGRLDTDIGKVHVHDSPEPGDEDLLDLAAVQALIKGGSVYAVRPEEVPDGAPLAAILRY
jgi:hypothetical protein